MLKRCLKPRFWQWSAKWAAEWAAIFGDFSNAKRPPFDCFYTSNPTYLTKNDKNDNTLIINRLLFTYPLFISKLYLFVFLKKEGGGKEIKISCKVKVIRGE